MNHISKGWEYRPIYLMMMWWRVLVVKVCGYPAIGSALLWIKLRTPGGSWRGSFSTVATVLHNTVGEKSLQLLWETRRHPLPIPFDTRPLMLLVGITPEQGSSEKHPAVVLFSHYCMHYWYRPHLKHVFKRATIFAISICYMHIICTKTTQTIPQIPQTHCGANRTPNTSHQAQAQTTRTHCKCCGNDRAHQDHNIELFFKYMRK